MVDEKILHDFIEQFEEMDKEEVKEKLLGIANWKMRNVVKSIYLNYNVN